MGWGRGRQEPGMVKVFAEWLMWCHIGFRGMDAATSQGVGNLPWTGVAKSGRTASLLSLCPSALSCPFLFLLSVLGLESGCLTVCEPRCVLCSYYSKALFTLRIGDLVYPWFCLWSISLTPCSSLLLRIWESRWHLDSALYAEKLEWTYKRDLRVIPQYCNAQKQTKGKTKSIMPCWW